MLGGLLPKKVGKKNKRKLEEASVLDLRAKKPLVQINGEAIPHFYDKFKKPVFAFVSIFLILSVFSYVFRGEASVTTFFPTSCLGGWQNPNKAEGIIEVENNSSSFSSNNSSILSGSISEIFCGGFEGEVAEDSIPKKFTVKLSWLVTDTLLPEEEVVINEATTPEEIQEILEEDVAPVEPVVESTESAEDSLPQEANETPESVSEPAPTPEASAGEPTPESAPAPEPTPAPAEPAPQSFLDFFISTVFAEDLVEGEIPTPTVISEPEVVEVLPEALPATAEETVPIKESTQLVDVPTETPEAISEELATEQVANNSAGAFLEVLYTLDGTNWATLGKVTRDHWMDASFEITSEELSQWEDLSKLQISLRALPTIDTPPVIYLDSVYVEIEYEGFSVEEGLTDAEVAGLPRIEIDADLIFNSPKDIFRAEEDPAFEFNQNKLNEFTEPEVSPTTEEIISPSSPLPELDKSEPEVKPAESTSAPEVEIQSLSEEKIEVESTSVHTSVVEVAPEPVATPPSEIKTEPLPEPAPSEPVSFIEKFQEFFKTQEVEAQSAKKQVRVVKSEIISLAGGGLSNSAIVEEVDGKLSLRVPKPESGFKPGRYKMHLEILVRDQVLVLDDEFVWGVLALNTNKSFFLPDELAYFQIASLDELGNTLCDSNLALTITKPSGEKKVFETNDQSLSFSSDCGANNVTDLPDYFTNMVVNEVGTYTMHLKNLDKNYEVTDYFRTESVLPLQLERIGATRINPFKSEYVMTLKVKSFQDFNGKIIEHVPEGFEVKTADVNHPLFSVNEVFGRGKDIIWDVSMYSGQEITLSYKYQSPKVSPEFYLLGKAKAIESVSFVDGILGEEPQAIFTEAREWQLASDATDGTGFLVWDEDGANNTTPHYSSMDTSGVLAAESQMQNDEDANDDTNHTIIEAAPNRHEYIAARLIHLGELDVQVYTEGAWADGTSAPTNGDFTTGIGTTNDVYRGFDVAYEGDTGDGIVVYESSSTGDGALKYRVWDGAAWGSEQTIDYSAVDEGNDVARWVECEGDYDTDYIICAWREQTNLGIYGAVWNGSSWVNIAAIDTADGISTRQNFDVAWEGSGDGMVVYGEPTSVWLDAATYTRDSGWTDTSGITAGGAATQWVTIAGSPNNDYIAVMFQDTSSTTSADISVEMWNGSDWTTISTPTEDTDINSNGFAQGMDVAWERNDDQALFVWRDGNDAGSNPELVFSYMIFDISAGQFQTIDDDLYCNFTAQQVTGLASAEASNGPCQGAGPVSSGTDPFAGVDLNPAPDTNEIIVLTENTTANLVPEGWMWNGDGTWSQDGSWDGYEADLSTGATLSASLPTKPYDFAYRRSQDTNVAVLGSQTSTVTIGSTGNYIGGAFAITTTASGANIDSIKITESGTVDGQELDNVKLYYESDSVAPYNCASVSYGGGETQYGSTVAGGFNAANGTATFSYSAGTGPSVTSTSALCVYAVMDVSTSTSAGQTIEIGIANPSTDVSVDTGSIGPTFARNISGTTTIAMTISGTCKAYDQSTNCGDLGDIAYAVNGTLRAEADTGGGTGGTFTISGITTAIATNDIVTVFVNGAPATASNRAGAITKYDGTGNISGVELFKEHLTIGSDDTGATLTSVNLGSYDNSVASGDDDVFWDYRTDWSTTALTATGASVVGFQIDCDSPATSCNTFSSQEELYIKSGWTYRPDSAGSDVVVTHDLENLGTLNMDDNDLGITGSFISTGTFTKTSGQEVIFTSTSTGETINSGGSAFHDVTFNGSGGGWTAVTSAVAIDGALTITAGNYDTGAVNNTVTGATSITGTLTISSTTGTKTFTGNVTVNSSGTWNETAAEDIEFAGDLTNNQTFTASTGVHTFSGTSKALAGTLSIPNTTVTGTLTNNGTLTVSTALSGSGTLTQGASDTLNIGGTSGITTLTATASGNTVSYTSTTGAQTVKGTTYYNLTIDKSGQTGTLGATTAVDGALTITAGTLQLSALGLTVTGATSITGTLNDNSATGTNLFVGAVTVNNGGTWTTTNDPAFTFRGGLTVNSTSTFTSGAGTYTFNTNAQTVDGTQTYTITNVQNDVTSGTGLTFSGSTATVTTLTQGTNAILTFSGAMPTITTLTATTSGNTVRYTSTAGAQTVKATTYVNVEIDKSGQTATLGGATTLTGNMTITAGTLDVDNVGNYALNVGGNWSNAGTFTARAGTVTLNTGTTATVGGGPTTFYNLTITHTSAKEVNFSTTAAHIIHVTNTFSATGGASQLIKLYSTSAGNKWHFHPTGTATVDYVDTKDGGCESGSVLVSKTNFTNSGNNEFCWGGASLTMSISSTSVSLGTLSTSSASTGSHTISVAGTGSGGFAITYNGATLTRSGGAQTISAYSAGTSSPGTEGFGINLKDNATPNIGANPVTNSGTCTVASDYNTADTFHFVSSTITNLTSISSAADCVFTVSYVANISNITEAGQYATDITYIATGTF